MPKPRNKHAKREPKSSQPPGGPERHGVVKRFDKAKRVGVIAPEDGGKDVACRPPPFAAPA